MADTSGPTRALMSAHRNLSSGFEKARGRLADIPLGNERLDPRTVRSRQQFIESLGREESPLANARATSVTTTPRYEGKGTELYARSLNRLPDYPGRARQNPKRRAAGRVVDPTSIETAQSLDPQSPDVGSGTQDFVPAPINYMG